MVDVNDVRIVAHCRDRTKTSSGDAIQGGVETERIFGETWVPFSKIVSEFPLYDPGSHLSSGASVGHRGDSASSTVPNTELRRRRRPTTVHSIDTVVADGTTVDDIPLDQQLTDRHRFQASV